MESQRAGLAAAHNRGLQEIDTPLVAITDDDVLADPRWLERVVDAFAATDGVGCVTGNIEPEAIETTAQRWLDAYAGFGKGSERRLFDLVGRRPPDDPLFPFTAGSLGSGANMAFSMAALERVGGFDPALGAGTRARGGDDLAAFFSVLQHGYVLAYDPAALVRHRHAAGYDALRRQVFGYGVGLSAYLAKCLVDHPRLALAAVRRLPQAARHVLRRDSAKNSRLPPDYPRELVVRERLGLLVGPFAYLAGRIATRRRRP